MAKTYYAEGRQLAYVLRGLFIIGGLGIFFKFPGLHWGFFFGILIGAVIVADILGALWTRNRRAKKKSMKASKHSVKKTAIERNSNQSRSDEMILTSNLNELSGAEFERLLALYFRDNGYKVDEVGVGGNDGGVDLVITDNRGEKTAVQAKCYADHNKVPVMTIRELVGAKRNHDCILSLLVTTSDLTIPAKNEAEKHKVDYWHGALLEHKLTSWGKWRPNKASRSKARMKNDVTRNKKSGLHRNTTVSISNEKTCKCGSSMVKRKNKQGVEFWGCTKFPRCRQTSSV